MKKLIIPLLVLYVNLLFAQENTYNKKHNLLWDVGINNNGHFKDIYFDKFEAPNYDILNRIVTEYPGYYLKPGYSFHSGLLYKYQMKSGINTSVGLFFTNRLKVITRSIDSVKTYYLFPDSIKKMLPYYTASAPLYEKNSSNSVELHFSVGYKYRRFSITSGIIINMINFRQIKTEHLENKKRLVKEKEYFGQYGNLIYFQTKFKYLIIKNKMPLNIYIGFEDVLKFGIELNLSYLKF